jgi:hypothetical protein
LAYLDRTPSSAGNRRTFTFSCWIKLLKFSSGYAYPITAGPDSNTVSSLSFSETGSATGTNDLSFFDYQSGSYTTRLISTQVFRDSSAWYHILLSVDTTQASQSDRVKIYINGSRVTSFSTATYPSQNTQMVFNNNVAHIIGAYTNTKFRYSDCYQTETYLIDGQALTPSSFGETDAITGRWKAKAYSGTYGTNGFYLKFADNSGTTSTTLGKDSSGNGNNWTPNNFSVTAGAGNDSLVDSPTNYGSGTGTVGNFCTWNPLINGDSAANGNLDVTNDTARGNHELMKYDAYWEVTSTGGTCLAGIISTAATSTITVGSAKTFGFKLSEAGVFEYANITDGSSFTSQATATTPPFPYASTGASITASLNCGQRAFAGTLPTGYKPICTTSLDQPTIQKPSKYMDALAYTGTGASNAISSLGFSPDLVWIKNRGTTTDHALYDIVRGAQQQLSSNSTAAEVTSSTGLTAFDSAGFTIGTSSLLNTSGTQYVAWSWDAGSTNSTNTAGSTTSVVRVNPQAGFSVVSYTGNGSAATIGHGLGATPKMIIAKTRSTTGDWVVGHASLDSSSPWGYYIFLSSTAARNSASAINTWGNNTIIVPPTSTVFSVGNGANLNSNGITYIAYCFAEIEGYSKFGSYTGNGSADGPFVWCGFRPRWVMVKMSSSTGDWYIFDTARDSFNATQLGLIPNSSQADGTYTGWGDVTSNGFKIRRTDAAWNTSGGTYIFAAFAESPFKYARAR